MPSATWRSIATASLTVSLPSGLTAKRPKIPGMAETKQPKAAAEKVAPGSQAEPTPEPPTPEQTPQEREVAERKEAILEQEAQAAEAHGREPRTWEELQEVRQRASGATF